ncbi:MAG: rRNA adenine N-6-methyltransferase family protein, partial [Candidatus Binataceae bacterium]
GDLVVEFGAGLGAITIALAKRQVDVVAIEIDPVWVARLRDRVCGELLILPENQQFATHSRLVAGEVRRGTESSNPARSANQSVVLSYNLEWAENPRVTRRLCA